MPMSDAALSGERFLLDQSQAVFKGLHRGVLPFVPAPLIRPLFIVPLDSSIQVGLQFLDAAIDRLAKPYPVELIQHRLVEALHDAINLWALGLGPTVIDVFHGQVQFVLVALRVAAVLGASIGQHAQELNLVLVK